MSKTQTQILILILISIGVISTIFIIKTEIDKKPKIIQYDTVNYNIECIDGVQYFTGWGRSSKFIFSPHFKPDGSLYLCE